MASSSSQSSAAAASLLQRQLKEITNAKDVPGISVGLLRDNVFNWEVILMLDHDLKYYGGAIFRAHLTFPPEYPHLPPKMVFQTPIPFHPNIYPNGELCISILHPPEDDKYGYENASERWSPVQTPETILLSVISLFSEPNEDSPANLDAAKLLRQEKEGGPKEFRKRVRKCVRESVGED
ncbi:Uu.00g024120.m01.CDS01 [Anthostomella pinea]|uniref:Ubiquitin-conjugating enzyme E2 2 n=1 Tax=Anthostomella pinea TaxID=933095 RepID=A0AAI8W1E2_9PEZI|nr:Uu.00g024120.m01.CDS01 [Anthostomella pinea]